MPPKPKFTREEVINAAYDLLEQGGMDAVVAREVGNQLGCTVAPIFTCFENMEELRAAVHQKALAFFGAYMSDCVDYFPAFKEFGLRWVRLASEHPHVYSEIFLRKNDDVPGDFFNNDFWQMLTPILTEITTTFSVSMADAEHVMKDMLIYAHGLAALQISSHSPISEEELRINLSRMCISHIAGIQARDGRINEPMLRNMLAHLDMIPHKKSELPPHE